MHQQAQGLLVHSYATIDQEYLIIDRRYDYNHYIKDAIITFISMVRLYGAQSHRLPLINAVSRSVRF
jgi:hypothetical protein